MVFTFGRLGQFLECGNYPECKNKREVAKETSNGDAASAEGADGEKAEEVPVCEHCGKEMALKKGRFGSFYGCTGYPECKNIRKIDKKSGEAKTTVPPVELDEICPKDGAKL